MGTERDTRLVGFALLLLLLELPPRRSRLLLWPRPVRALRSFPPRSLRSRPLLATMTASRELPFRRAAGGLFGRAGTGTAATTTAAGLAAASASSRPAPPPRRRRRRRRRRLPSSAWGLRCARAIGCGLRCALAPRRRPLHPSSDSSPSASGSASCSVLTSTTTDEASPAASQAASTAGLDQHAFDDRVVLLGVVVLGLFLGLPLPLLLLRQCPESLASPSPVAASSSDSASLTSSSSSSSLSS